MGAGGGLGYPLPNGAPGYLTNGAFTPPLEAAGAHAADESPFGVRGLLANARELVTSSVGDETFLAKGAGGGDAPDEAAIYLLRPVAKDERHPTTGFRVVQELP